MPWSCYLLDLCSAESLPLTMGSFSSWLQRLALPAIRHLSELALLLGLAFPGSNPGETRVFDCNKPDPHGNTALLLACKAGSLELATMLKDAGADVSVANKRRDTPLLAALAAGNLELATVLLSWGADVKAERRDGAGLIALAIHSKRPDSISFTYDMIAVCT